MKIIILIGFALLFFIFPASAQSEDGLSTPKPAVSPSPASSPVSVIKELPRGFRKLQLGFPLQSIKDLLKEDPYFNYQGDPDVSLLLKKNQHLIECEGRGFIERAFFQFYNKRLLSITFILRKDKLDYYTLYTNFSEKYGKFTRLSPQMTVWENDEVRFALEKPLTIKYIDLITFNSLKVEDEEIPHTMDIISKENFLNEF